MLVSFVNESASQLLLKNGCLITHLPNASGDRFLNALAPSPPLPLVTSPNLAAVYVNLSNAGKENVGLQVPLNKTLVRKNFVR